MTTAFTTKILGFGNNAAIEVPEVNIAELGGGKRAPVVVILGKYSYKSTVANMDGMTLLPLAKVHRDATGINIGDTISVTLKLESGYREVDMPSELKLALEKENLVSSFAKFPYSKRKEFCRQVAEAKSSETKERRIEKLLAELVSEVVLKS